MNEQLPYELIIAQKLQQLPPPDLADAIWARIEKQLDLDMPTEDGGNPPSSPSGSGWIGGAALGIFIAAFILVFILFRKERSTAPQTVAPQDVPATQVPAENRTDTAREVEQNRIIIRPPARNAEPPPDVPTSEPKVPDTVVTNVPSPQADTGRSTTVITPPQLPRQDSGKPKRGVSGINDSDYRIVPKANN